MNITIHTTVLPHTDPDASLAFYRDILGFEVRTDVGSGTMRWVDVGPANQPETSILLSPPAVDPGITDRYLTGTGLRLRRVGSTVVPRARRSGRRGHR